jgi:predicted RNA binding protein YcfA (HicA-like mRNA interferase family)
VKDAKRADVERFLTHQGWEHVRTKGSHGIWQKPESKPLSIPRHGKVSPGVLRQVEKQVGFVPKEWK